MNEGTKNRCVVLLPAGAHYERLFDEILELAIIETGLVPVWSKQIAKSPTSVNVFVDEIEHANTLFADISENTPEIWLAIGCALSLGKPLCLISSQVNPGLPLAIQELPVISYPTDAFPSDYIRLQQSITKQISVTSPSAESAKPAPQSVQAATIVDDPFLSDSEQLVSYEIMALTIIDLHASEAGLSPRDLGLEMRARSSAHLTSHAMNGLKRRRFIERKPVQIDRGNELHISENLFVTREGQDWLVRHGKKPAAHRSTTHSRELFLSSR
jgi:hypothetical protein